MHAVPTLATFGLVSLGLLPFAGALAQDPGPPSRGLVRVLPGEQEGLEDGVEVQEHATPFDRRGSAFVIRPERRCVRLD